MYFCVVLPDPCRFHRVSSAVSSPVSPGVILILTPPGCALSAVTSRSKPTTDRKPKPTSRTTRTNPRIRNPLVSSSTTNEWTQAGQLGPAHNPRYGLQRGPNPGRVRTDRRGPREPTEKPRPSGTAVRGERPQGRAVAVNRWKSVRHGSEQRATGQLSLDGSRGGGGNRDSPRRNAGQPRASTIHTTRTFLSEPLARSKICTKNGGCSGVYDSLR